MWIYLGDTKLTKQYWLEDLYDAIVDASGNGDYTTIWAAIDAGKRIIFVKNGTYNETPKTINGEWLVLTWEWLDKVTVNYTYTATGFPWTAPFAFTITDWIIIDIKWFTFNLDITADGRHSSLISITWQHENRHFVKVDDCRIDARLTWNIQYGSLYIWNGQTEDEGIFNNCEIKIHNTNNYTRAAENSYYNKCYLSASNDGWDKVDFSVDNAENSVVEAQATTVNCILSASKCRFSTIRTLGATSRTTQIDARNCSNCNISNRRAYTSWVSYNSVVKSWAENTAYAVWDLVTIQWSVWSCTTAHTSWTDVTADISNFSQVTGSHYQNITDCDVSDSWIVYLHWMIKGNTLSLWTAILTHRETEPIKQHPWVTMIWNSTEWTSTSAFFTVLKVLDWLNVVSWNTFALQRWIYYNDDYNIIKDNTITGSQSSANPTITVSGSSTWTSKVSDNIIWNFY